jgi:putative membrane protein
MHIALQYLGTVAAILLTVYVVPGIIITGGWLTVFLAALVWSVLVIVIKPVLKIITLPITVLTFGLFALVLNAFLFYVITWVVPGFAVSGFLAALIGALVLSILTSLIYHIF